MNEYINLDENNIEEEHICCAIGDPKHQDGVDKKKEWIKRGFKESPKELATIFKNRKDYYTNMDMIENSYLK